MYTACHSDDFKDWFLLLYILLPHAARNRYSTDCCLAVCCCCVMFGVLGPGRLYTLKTEKGAESYKATLTVPCDTTGAQPGYQTAAAHVGPHAGLHLSCSGQVHSISPFALYC